MPNVASTYIQFQSLGHLYSYLQGLAVSNKKGRNTSSNSVISITVCFHHPFTKNHAVLFTDFLRDDTSVCVAKRITRSWSWS